ncbi:hypothetical protein JX266_014256 [Neoarthrinium moseri]|nr:hypothetical protein JX266_014256 [Neoarthrinium moseri]
MSRRFVGPLILPIELLGSNIAPATYHVSALAASATPNPRAGRDGRSRRAVGASNCQSGGPAMKQSLSSARPHKCSEPASATSEKHPAPGSSSANHDAASKRRRGLGIVTPNACTECRKKRAKVRVIEQQCQTDSVIEALEAGAVGGDVPGGSDSGIMPLALQLPQKHEYDQNSVWEFSSHRQTQSTTTDPCGQLPGLDKMIAPIGPPEMTVPPTW